MEFCDSCGSAMVSIDDEWVCRSCEPERVSDGFEENTSTPSPRSAALTDLPTTDSGTVRKGDAMTWLTALDEPSAAEFKNGFIPKPNDFTGSTYASSVSNIRITGDPRFVETIAGLLKPIADLEGMNTRVQINLQETEDRDTPDDTVENTERRKREFEIKTATMTVANDGSEDGSRVSRSISPYRSGPDAEPVVWLVSLPA